jgi:hypothetical protein
LAVESLHSLVEKVDLFQWHICVYLYMGSDRPPLLPFSIYSPEYISVWESLPFYNEKKWPYKRGGLS